MSDFDLEPLIRQEEDAWNRAILSSAKHERSAPGGRARALAALGLAPPTGLSAVGSTKAVLGAVGVLALGAATVLGTTRMDHAPDPGPSRIETPSPEVRRGPALPSVEAMPIPSTELVVTPEMLSSSEARFEPPSRATHEAAPAKVAPSQAPLGAQTPLPLPAPLDSQAPLGAQASPSSLARETAQVNAAGQALTRGFPNEARSILDAYDDEYPRGVFKLEVAVLRIEALARAGRAAEAERLATAFLAQQPTGPLARRVNTALSSLR